MAPLPRAEHRIPQRGQGRHAEQAQRHPASTRASGPRQEQQREQQVELLFDPQRPGVRVRIELGTRREVIIAGAGQHPVAQPEERHAPGLVAGLAEPGFGNQQRAEHRRRQQAHHQCRGDTAHAARIEARQPGPAADRRQAIHRGADHETGNDEEHVHASEATRQPAGLEVIEDDRQHRDRTQAINVREIPWTAFLHGPAPDMQRAPDGAQCVQQWWRWLTRPDRRAPGTAGRHTDLRRPVHPGRPSAPRTVRTPLRLRPAPRRSPAHSARSAAARPARRH